MTDVRLSRVLAAYEQGDLTEGSVCLEALIAAGEGDAEAVFNRLPRSFQEVVARDVADAGPARAGIIESYCGSAPNEEYEADRRRREDLMRRGIVALRRVTASRTRGG